MERYKLKQYFWFLLDGVPIPKAPGSLVKVEENTVYIIIDKKWKETQISVDTIYENIPDCFEKLEEEKS